VLAPGWPVNLRLLNPAVITTDIAVSVRLRSNLGTDNWVLGVISGSVLVDLDAQGDAIVPAPLASQYCVDVSLRPRSGIPVQRIPFDPPITVDVSAEHGAPFVDVPLTHEQVSAALVAIGG
jgi:hypothetical protein